MEQSTLKLRTIISRHQWPESTLSSAPATMSSASNFPPLLGLYSPSPFRSSTQTGISFGMITISTSASTLQLVSLSSRGRAITSRPITSTTREPVISGLKYQCPIPITLFPSRPTWLMRPSSTAPSSRNCWSTSCSRGLIAGLSIFAYIVLLRALLSNTMSMPMSLMAALLVSSRMR